MNEIHVFYKNKSIRNTELKIGKIKNYVSSNNLRKNCVARKSLIKLDTT